MKLYPLIIIVLLSVVSCKSKSVLVQDEVKNNEVPIVISKGNLYGAGAEGISKQNLVITNEKDWKALLTKMNTENPVSDGFLETIIDFSKYSVIAVFSNVKGSGGHTIDLNISTTSEHTLVTISKKGPNGVATSVMTQPYCIVKITKTNLPILFQ